MRFTSKICISLVVGMLYICPCASCEGNPVHVSIKETDILDAMIYTLESKAPKSDIEENILAVAKIVKENSPYLDEGTIKDFNDMAYMVRIMDEKNGAARDFIAKKVERLAETQKALYCGYLSSAESSYDRIAKLLEETPASRQSR